MGASAKAAGTWDRAEHAYHHYVDYVARKPDKYALSFTDLVYVKNFKGGSTVIAEPIATLAAKLQQYEQALRTASKDSAFSRALSDLDDQDYLEAREQIVAFAALSRRAEARINGFGVSFSSALLHFYFPRLVPILDRRAVNGANLKGIEVDAQDQVTNLLQLYPALVDCFRITLRENAELTLRELDRYLFSQELRRPPFRNKDDG
jgi:hypothetical protein